jgi:hypothetical protein
MGGTQPFCATTHAAGYLAMAITAPAFLLKKGAFTKNTHYF